jgi:hypothetical protein
VEKIMGTESNFFATGFGILVFIGIVFYMLCAFLAPVFLYLTANRARQIRDRLDILIALQEGQSATKTPINTAQKPPQNPASRPRDAWIQG